MTQAIQRRVELLLDVLSRPDGIVDILTIARDGGITRAQARHALFAALLVVHFWDYSRVPRGRTFFYATKGWHQCFEPKGGCRSDGWPLCSVCGADDVWVRSNNLVREGYAPYICHSCTWQGDALN